MSFSHRFNMLSIRRVIDINNGFIGYMSGDIGFFRAQAQLDG